MFHYYVYYRVDPARSMEANAAVQQVGFEVEAELGIPSRRLRKRDEPMLWMEVYENVASVAAFESALEHAVNKSGLLQYLPAGERRHVECFED